MRLGCLAMWEASSSRSKGDSGSGYDGACESKCGNVKKTHGEVVEK